MTFSRRGYCGGTIEDNNRGQQQRTTTRDLSCKGYGRYGKGISAEGDAGGTTEDNNRGPQLQRILTGDTTKDHKQKRILEVQKRTGTAKDS
jgi:hypothetical protein